MRERSEERKGQMKMNGERNFDIYMGNVVIKVKS